MKKLSFFICAVTLAAACASCETTEAPAGFGNMEIADLPDAVPTTESADYIAQRFPNVLSVFDGSGQPKERYNVTTLTYQCFDDRCCSECEIVAHIFRDASAASSYYAHTPDDMYELTENIIYMSVYEPVYKTDILDMMENDLFDGDITYISMPYLTSSQSGTIIPEHTVRKCK